MTQTVEPELVETVCSCGHAWPLHLRPNVFSARGRCGVVTDRGRCRCQSPKTATRRRLEGS